MSDSKVFMIPDAGSQSSLDPNLLMALNQNGGFGGNGNWMWIFFLWFLWPLMRGGNYGFGNSEGFGPLSNQINNDSGRELLMQAINKNGTAIDNLASMFNCKTDTITQAINGVLSQIQSVGNQVGMSGMQIINAVQAGNTQLGQQIAQCCCENRLAICQQTNALQSAINNVSVGQERGFSSVNFETQKQTCDIQNSIKDAVTNITAQFGELRNSQLQDKLDASRELISTLQNQISNEHQTAAVNQIVANATAPLGVALNGLQTEVNNIKCQLPQTVTLPYSCATAVPTALAYNYGYYGNGFWG